MQLHHISCKSFVPDYGFILLLFCCCFYYNYHCCCLQTCTVEVIIQRYKLRFIIIVAAQMGACGGKYATNTGTIYSPEFPGCYHYKSNCSWSITTAKDHVSLDFTIFNFSNESFEVIVAEEYNGSVAVLGQYNKMSPPTSTIYSRSEEVFIQLNRINESNGCGVFAIDLSGQVRCEVPDEVDNGRADTDSICLYCSGDIVTVVCEPGYVVNSTYSSVECHNGEWNASLPQCMAAYSAAYPSTSIIMIEKTDSLQTTQDTGSGLSIGFNLGSVFGLTLFVVLIVLSISLCSILTRKRDSGQCENNEKADTQAVRLKEIRILDPQYQMRDESDGCIANTDSRPLQDTPDESQDMGTFDVRQSNSIYENFDLESRSMAELLQLRRC
ncbi:uncharacterized protein [Ptychodera flava]|uniref:uncharacterized protein n=1 Tax=Ptychodera flava TaxID=63121 RepID=UPI00396A5813